MCLIFYSFWSFKYFNSDIKLLNNFSINISLWTLFVNNFISDLLTAKIGTIGNYSNEVAALQAFATVLDCISFNFNFILDRIILLSRSNSWNILNFHLNIQIFFFHHMINFILWISFFMSDALIALKIFESCLTWCRSMNWSRSFIF